MFTKRLVVQGNSYKPERLFPTRPTSVATLKSRVESPQGGFYYANVKLPRGVWIELAQGSKRGHVAFTTDVVIPSLYNAKKPDYSGGRPWTVWMSHTPMEILTQRAGIRKATGTVMLGGLGLGYLLRKVAEKPSVKKIIVVEQSQELLDWYGTALCQRYAEKYDTPIEVICDDVVTQLGQHGAKVRHLVDIWDNYPQEECDIRRKPEWAAALDRCRYFWGWGVTTSARY